MSTNVAGYLVLKNIPNSEWSCTIEPGRKVVGRSKTTDVRIPMRFRTVSRRHMEVWSDRRGIWIHDLGSSAGTNVNGVWVDQVAQAGLVFGDTVSLGGVELVVVAEIDELARFKPESADEIPTYKPQLPKISMSRAMAHKMSPAEIDVMLWLSRGYQGDEEIGRLLHRSPNTIRTEISNIFRKLELHSRAELMGWLKRAHLDGPHERLSRRSQNAG